jgi:NAD(P)-dependent dehydrogenase (short-subunit alcohol dehydrogenase family)
VRRKLSDGPRPDHRRVLWHRPGDDPGASPARSQGRGHRAAAGDPGRTYPLPSGSLRGFTVQPTVDAAIAAGPFDGLISNASETARGTVEATPLSEYERLLGLNFLGALRVTKAVLSGLPRAGGGRIVSSFQTFGRAGLLSALLTKRVTALTLSCCFH